ncbi:MAG: hypothetical protein BWK78_04995 [Thiotrichaceae bacterium IS1]|nr:MAG: hypothetical protein BWK78_04995 [Thiotrichaceae bacterium IS1]
MKRLSFARKMYFSTMAFLAVTFTVAWVTPQAQAGENFGYLASLKPELAWACFKLQRSATETFGLNSDNFTGWFEVDDTVIYAGDKVSIQENGTSKEVDCSSASLTIRSNGADILLKKETLPKSLTIQPPKPSSMLTEVGYELWSIFKGVTGMTSGGSKGDSTQKCGLKSTQYLSLPTDGKIYIWSGAGAVGCPNFSTFKDKKATRVNCNKQQDSATVDMNEVTVGGKKWLVLNEVKMKEGQCYNLKISNWNDLEIKVSSIEKVTDTVSSANFELESYQRLFKMLSP